MDTRRDGTGNVWVMDAEAGEDGAQNIFEIFSQEEKQDITWNPNGKAGGDDYIRGRFCEDYHIRSEGGGRKRESRKWVYPAGYWGGWSN